MRQQQIYVDRAEAFELERDSLRRKYDFYAIVRLISFLVGIGMIILAFNIQWLLGLISLFVFLIFFGYFMLWHEKIKRKANRANGLSKINKSELKYLNFDYSDFYNGEEYQDLSHPYTADLDVFGNNSLFQSMCRSESFMGRDRLAQYLSQYSPLKEIQENQGLIRELAEHLDWRQKLQYAGKGLVDYKRDLINIRKWLNAERFIKDKPFYKLMRFLNPIWVIGTGLCIWFFNFPLSFIVLSILPPVLLLGRTFKRVNEVHEMTADSVKILKKYGRMMHSIERAEFKANKFLWLQEVLKSEGSYASVAIKQLAHHVSQLDLRANVFTLILNLIFLWDFHWVLALEKWREKHKGKIQDWFDAMAEIDALQSLATFAYNRNDFVFPMIHEQNELIMRSVGHPMISEALRVDNDVEMPSKEHIKLITGSNMSGKSTFLRTIGINMILAYAGAPVCAKACKLPLLSVFTSMRTKDALHEATSSFYAELKRLKFVLEAVRSGENIFFLLDEILKGTNSEDRHLGSRSLIEQLIQNKGAGFIATHDLELSDMENQAEGHVENLCFDVEVQNGLLVFNYKIKKGVCSSFNATILMKEMGIDIPEDKLGLHD